jgi:hypothetical protein
MSKRKRVPGSAGDPGKGERLAAALRANLRRRKAQARAKGGAGDPDKAANQPEFGKKSG